MDMNEENKNAAEQQEEGTGMKGIIEEVNIDEEMRSAYIDMKGHGIWKSRYQKNSTA